MLPVCIAVVKFSLVSLRLLLSFLLFLSLSFCLSAFLFVSQSFLFFFVSFFFFCVCVFFFLVFFSFFLYVFQPR